MRLQGDVELEKKKPRMHNSLNTARMARTCFTTHGIILEIYVVIHSLSSDKALRTHRRCSKESITKHNVVGVSRTVLPHVNDLVEPTKLGRPVAQQFGVACPQMDALLCQGHEIGEVRGLNGILDVRRLAFA